MFFSRRHRFQVPLHDLWKSTLEVDPEDATRRLIRSQRFPFLTSQTLDILSYISYNRHMPRGEGIRPNLSIRMNPEALHKARVAAVTQKKTLGQWLEQAIMEKIEREQKLSKEDQR